MRSALQVPAQSFSRLFRQLSNLAQFFVRFGRRMHVIFVAACAVSTPSFDARAAGVCSQRVLGEAPKPEKISAHGAGADAANLICDALGINGERAGI